MWVSDCCPETMATISSISRLAFIELDDKISIIR
jgi:hypothetical protein